ncbi:MAG: hypothetical protein LBH11_06905 [Propionibacteriaceae bacterium]|jgi:hypothetical protein|nr:hypothetical protein [Propionibacteriaceae bacterium]
MTSGLEALARSLTGEPVPPPENETRLDDAIAVIAWLEQAGWTHERIATVRRSRETTGERWPLPVSPDEYAPIGAARFAAARAAVVASLAPPSTRVRDAATPLDDATRRLLAEAPPHHGPVG